MFEVLIIKLYLKTIKCKVLRRMQAHTWFLKLVSVQMSLCVLVCVPVPRLLLSSGMVWHDIDLIQLVKQVIQLFFGDCSQYR